jgi:hypothetical protein
MSWMPSRESKSRGCVSPVEFHPGSEFGCKWNLGSALSLSHVFNRMHVFDICLVRNEEISNNHHRCVSIHDISDNKQIIP